MTNENLMRQFVTSDKPDWCISTDALVMCALIALDGEQYPGHDIFAKRCAMKDSKSLLRSIRRLQSSGWIEVAAGRALTPVKVTWKPAKKEAAK